MEIRYDTQQMRVRVRDDGGFINYVGTYITNSSTTTDTPPPGGIGTVLNHIASLPTAPVIALGGSNPVAYTVGTPPVLLNSAAGTTITTSQSNFDTGKLTVQFSANGSTADNLAIVNQGTGAGQLQKRVVQGEP